MKIFQMKKNLVKKHETRNMQKSMYVNNKIKNYNNYGKNNI